MGVLAVLDDHLRRQAIDNEANKAVFNEDPKSLETLEWIFDGMASDENITYGGSLPKGQGIDALFYAQQLASCQMGRWILPNLKKLKFSYDIAPYPSEDGKTIMPVNIPVASMAVNAKAKDADAALWWTTRYVSVEGQKARLAGGGNAVPSIPGAEEVVTEGNLPEHAAYWNEVAKVGYAIPLAIASKPRWRRTSTPRSTRSSSPEPTPRRSPTRSARSSTGS